jgi:hypothetical protein
MAKISMSSVWDRATEFVVDNLARIIPFAAIIAGIATIQSLMSAATGATPGAAQLATSGIGIVLAVLSLFARLTIMAMAVDDRRASGEAAALVGGRLLAVIGIFLLLGIALTLFVMPLIIIPALSGLDLAALRNPTADTFAGLPPSVSLFIALYGLVLAVGLLWVAARLAVLLPVTLFERRGVGAFARSFALTAGNTFRILGVLLLIGLVGAVAALAAKGVVGTLLRFVIGDGGALGGASVLTALVVALVSVPFTVVADAFTAKLYIATRATNPDAA